jgi:hypothetical protein
MKKHLLFAAVTFQMMFLTAFAQSDTIIGFNFADDTDLLFQADMGLSGNLTYDVRAEDTTGATRTLTYTNGVTDFAATAEGWDDGADNKFWSIKFKASGYQTFKLYSKQRSGATNAGPRDWKVQTRKSGGVYEDVTGGTITVGNDWTSGVVDGIDLPANLNDPGSTSIFVRWIMTSNNDINGGTVAVTGTSKIDDIIVTGVSVSGIETVIYQDHVSVYPNPCSDILNIFSEEEIDRIEMVDMQGKTPINTHVNYSELTYDISQFAKGIYTIRIWHKNETKPVSRRIIVL